MGSRTSLLAALVLAGFAPHLAADEGAPTVVILPPGLPTGSTPETRVAAELLCDRLAEVIDQTRAARVVDRAQLDRVLRERELAADPSKAMLSYDAMVRVRVDATCLVPKVRLDLLELSTGNVMASADYPWPMKDANLGKMASLCKSALSSLGKLQREKLRVRMTGVDGVGAQVRMRPLGLRLNKVFQKSLQRPGRIVLVRHLEAGTSKEESLLLLMGLTRLAGSRRFTPQADATVELRVIERDSVGKTFEQTPVEIGVRLRKGAKYTGDWVITAGKVKDFDRLVQQAWSEFAKGLTEAEADAAAKFLDEMAVRRKQAEAELKAADGVKPDLPFEERMLAQIAHMDTALKIDPTYEPAAYRLVCALRSLCGRQYTVYMNTKDEDLHRRINKRLYRMARECARYFQQFAGDGEELSQVQQIAWLPVRFTLLLDLARGKKVALTPDLRLILDAAREIVDSGVTGDVRKLGHGLVPLTNVVYRGMKQSGVPLNRRRRWLDGVLKRCDEQMKQLPKIEFLPELRREWNVRLRLKAAGLAIDDGEPERAKKLVEHVRARFSDIKVCNPGEIVRLMRLTIEQTKDTDTLAKFDRWAQRYNRPACFIHIKWPRIDVFARGKDPTVKMTHIRHKALSRYGIHAPISALAEGDKQLYIVMSQESGSNAICWSQFEGVIDYGISQIVAQIPLDDKGRPVGREVVVDQRWKRKAWDSISILPQPKVRKHLHVLCAKYVNGKLCLGTMHSGLLVFDPKTEKWNVYGPKQGLPIWRVYSLFPIGENVLFCSGHSEHNDLYVHYKLDISTAKVTLLRRRGSLNVHWSDRRHVPHRMVEVWWSGENLMGWDRYGLWKNLLSDTTKQTRLSPNAPYGWRTDDFEARYILDMTQIGDRRFITCGGGLHEIDSAGKVIRTWIMRLRFQPAGAPLAWRHNDIVVPRDCPADERMLKSGNMLFFHGTCIFNSKPVAYDPQTDTWYCSLPGLRVEHAMGTNGGVWIGTRSGLIYINTADIIDAARSAGRVLTTKQWQEGKRKFIASASLLDQAKFAFGMRQFEKAERLLTQVLESAPDNAETLLLMGYLHDTWCTNKPDEAAKYYRRLEGLTGNPSAAMSGMWMRFHLHARRKEYAEAYRLTKEMPKRFGWLEDHARREMTYWESWLKKELAKKTSE